MNINKKIFFLLFFLFILININYNILQNKNFNVKLNYNKKKKIIIEVEIFRKKNCRGGSTKFVEGINNILPFDASSNCRFIASKNIYPINTLNKSDFFFLPYPRFNESDFDEWIKIRKTNKLILGPIFVPFLWKDFPNKNIWKERRFPEIIRRVKGIAVHSIRVRNYLAQKSKTLNKLSKYKIIRPCSNLNPKNVKSFKDRKIDILFFEKYKDLNRTQQGFLILKLFKNSTKKIEQLKYGNYTSEQMQKLANNSKFIIYFSFFDTGAIGLKEIQNYGVFAFSHQRDLVIDKSTSFFVPELADEFDMKKAYNRIMEKIETISKLNPDTNLIAKKNQEINKCEKSLDDLCESLS